MTSIFLDRYSSEMMESIITEKRGEYSRISFYVGDEATTYNLPGEDKPAKTINRVYICNESNEIKSNDYALQECIDNFTLENFENISYLKQLVLMQINLKYDETINHFTRLTPPGEVSTWGIQKMEAELYETTQKAPFLTNLAKIRGVELSDLIEKVKQKNALYVEAVSKLTGYRQKLEDTIMAAKKIEKLKSIKWEPK